MATSQAGTSGQAIAGGRTVRASDLLRGEVRFELWALDPPDRQYLADDGLLSATNDAFQWWFVQKAPKGRVISAIRVDMPLKMAKEAILSFNPMKVEVISKVDRVYPGYKRAAELLDQIDSAMGKNDFRYFQTSASSLRALGTTDHVSFIDFYSIQLFSTLELQANPNRTIVPQGEVRIQMTAEILANVLDDAEFCLRGRTL